MQLPLSWLAEMVELRGDAHAICEALTGAGIETEIASDDRPSWEGVITARLEAVEAHPDADRLTVTRPFDGSGERTVVCGAANHRAGDIVALATPGTKLPGGMKIKKSKVRGVPSEGMLCSTDELGLGADADGILILPPDTPLGVPLADVLSAGDVLLDVQPTANRGDCLSVLGVARELSAITGWPLRARGADESSDGLDTLVIRAVGTEKDRGSAGSGARTVVVRIDAPDGCPRYAGAVVTGVRIGPSPEWMQERLTAAGVRPINNVVDCTNYVMLELGNPLHAFDRRHVRGGQIVVRRATDGETMRTLDGRDHALLPSDLVIADEGGATAIAGVMGGEDSEVRDDTTELFLEAAHFDPGTVRAMAYRLKLGTEASYRFSRGVDPELPRLALSRLIELLERCSGASMDGEVLDLYPEPVRRAPIAFRMSRVAGLLGLDLSAEQVFALFRRDGLDPQNSAGFGADPAEAVRVSIPSYRFDLEREVDLLEEVARLNGLDALPERLPVRPLRAVPRQPEGADLNGVRDAAVAAGLSEAVHFSFIDPAWVEALRVAPEHPWRARAVSVENPLSEVGGILRPTLLPSLLRAVARNRAMGAADVRLFELRSVFAMREDGFAQVLQDGARPTDKTPVIERRTFAAVLVGRRNPPGWAWSDEAVDMHDIAAVAQGLLGALQAKGWGWRAGGLPPFLLEGEGAVLEGLGGRGEAGWMGRIDAPVLRAFDLDAVVWALEIDVDAVASKRAAPPSFQPFSRYPQAERDLAVVAVDGVPAGELLAEAERTARKAMKDSFVGVECFDVYRGEGIADGSRSLALRFRFRAMDRTLQDGAVDAALAKVAGRLEQREGVTLRR